MSDNGTDRELLERIRDIQEDIKGVPERGIDGIIPKLNKLEERQKEHEERIKDVEGFVQTIQRLPSSSKKLLRWLGLFAGLILTILGIWKWLHGH